MRTALIAFALVATCGFWSVSARAQSSDPKPRDQTSCEFSCQLDWGASCKGNGRENCDGGMQDCLERCRN
jgi:hypothetical protein